MGIPIVSSMDKKNMLPYTGKRHGSSMGFLNQLNFRDINRFSLSPNTKFRTVIWCEISGFPVNLQFH